MVFLPGLPNTVRSVEKNELQDFAEEYWATIHQGSSQLLVKSGSEFSACLALSP